MLGDLWPESDRESGKEEPDYIKTEREQFSSFRDLNKDGKMDRVGIVEWFYLYGSLILFPSIIEVVEGDSNLHDFSTPVLWVFQFAEHCFQYIYYIYFSNSSLISIFSIKPLLKFLKAI